MIALVIKTSLFVYRSSNYHSVHEQKIKLCNMTEQNINHKMTVKSPYKHITTKITNRSKILQDEKYRTVTTVSAAAEEKVNENINENYSLAFLNRFR